MPLNPIQGFIEDANEGVQRNYSLTVAVLLQESRQLLEASVKYNGLDSAFTIRGYSTS